MIRTRARLKQFAIAVTIVGALTACDSSTGPSDGTPAVSFDFSGARSGSFRVSTTADLPGYEPRSYLYSYSGFGFVSVVAFRLRDATSGDQVTVTAPSAVRTYEIGQCGVFAACPTVTGKLEMDFATQIVNPEGVSFNLTEGTITLTRSDSARVEGRFSGTGVTQRLEGGQFVTTGKITIRDGRFSAVPKPATWPFVRAGARPRQLR